MVTPVLLSPTRRPLPPFLPKQPADYNAFESVYHLSPTRVNYLQPLPPPHHHPPVDYGADLLENDRERIEDGRGEGEGGGGSGGGFGEQQQKPSGEALLLERLSESVWAEENALEAAAAAAAATAGIPGDGVDCTASPAAAAAAADGGSDISSEGTSLFDRASSLGAAAAAEVEVRAAERALARAALELGTSAITSGMEWAEREEERMSDEAAAAAMAAWCEEDDEQEAGGRLMARTEPRWGEAEVGEWDRGGDEAMEMSALAVTLRQYPE